MKLSIERDRLLRPLAYVTSVVEKRQTLPILGNVLLEYVDGALVMVGTDLETEILTRVEDVTGTEGNCTVTARKLYEICRSLPEDASLEITGGGDKTSVKSGRSRFSLQSLPASDFPRLEAQDEDLEFSCDRKALRRLLERTAFAMAQQDVRYYLNGCLLELRDSELRAVATDGHRLAKGTLRTEANFPEIRQVIVPRKAVMELIRLLEDEGPVRLALDTSHLRANLGPVVFTTKLIDGRFPDYEKVIPTSLSTHLLVDRLAFFDILARTAILTNEKFRGVRLNVESGIMRVTSHNPEQEEAVDEMEVEYAGGGIEIGFNVGYLMDALRAMETDQVDFGLQDANSSCTVQAPEDDGTLYLVMPMRL